MIEPIGKCRVCGGTDLTPLFSLGEQYVNDFPETGHERDGMRVPLELELCSNPACNLVQLRHTVPLDALYRQRYWYRSGVTQTMRDALQDVVDACLSLQAPTLGNGVLDIGSNDGTLLRLFPDHLRRVGVEPANNLATAENYAGLELVHDFWPCAIQGKFKIVTALGMFYDLEDPVPFVQGIADVLAPGGVFVAQLMCLWNMLKLGDVGNINHEHLEYYTMASLVNLYGQAGLEIIDIEEVPVNGSSYRIYAQRKDDHRLARPGAFNRMVQVACRELQYGSPETYQWFSRKIEEAKLRVVQFIQAANHRDQSVWVYGASTKGNTILQYYGLNLSSTTLIEAAAERSPEKWGRVTVGTGIPIKSEDEFRARRPDYALVLPYTFIDEFKVRELDWLKAGGQFIVPLPTPRRIYWDGERLQEEVLP